MLDVISSITPAIAQKSLSEINSYEELTKEELFQIGEIAAINSYNDDVANIILGVFLGSIAIDAVASNNKAGNRYKRWTKRLELDDRIISDKWFKDGFITKRKEQTIQSIRAGRLVGRGAAVVATVYLLTNIDEIDLGL